MSVRGFSHVRCSDNENTINVSNPTRCIKDEDKAAANHCTTMTRRLIFFGVVSFMLLAAVHAEAPASNEEGLPPALNKDVLSKLAAAEKFISPPILQWFCERLIQILLHLKIDIIKLIRIIVLIIRACIRIHIFIHEFFRALCEIVESEEPLHGRSGLESDGGNEKLVNTKSLLHLLPNIGLNKEDRRR